MASYLTIPDIVEAEPLHSISPSPDGVTFGIVIDTGNTTVELMRAQSEGLRIPLVVLATDAQMLALDEVFVTEVTTTTGERSATYATLLAEAVRFFSAALPVWWSSSLRPQGCADLAQPRCIAA